MPSAACAGRDGMDPAQSQARAALGDRAATPRSITPQTFLLQQRHPESLPSAGLISARPEIKENPPNGANLQPRGWARSWARGGGQHPQIQPSWVAPVCGTGWAAQSVPTSLGDLSQGGRGPGCHQSHRQRSPGRINAPIPRTAAGWLLRTLPPGSSAAAPRPCMPFCVISSVRNDSN